MKTNTEDYEEYRVISRGVYYGTKSAESKREQVFKTNAFGVSARCEPVSLGSKEDELIWLHLLNLVNP